MRREMLAVVTVLLTGIAAMRSSLPDLMVEKDDTTNEVQSNVFPNILTNSVDAMRDGGCVMEIQYVRCVSGVEMSGGDTRREGHAFATKRINGKCTKLGKGVEGCVAGSYIHPFHADCLFGR